MKKIYLTIQLTLLAFLMEGQCNPGFSNITASSTTACANGMITFNATGGSLPAGAYYNWRAYYTSGAPCNSNNNIDFGQQGSLVVVNGAQFQMPATGIATYFVRLTVVCSNGTRACASSEIAVTRIGAPIVLANAQQVFCPGTPASIAVTSTAGVTYSWIKNGVVVAGATTQTINFPSPTATIAGVYNCIVSGACGTTTSTAITFTTLGNQTVAGSSITSTNTSKVYSVTSQSNNGVAYSWSLTSGGTITGSANTNSVSVNWGSTIGIYTLTVTKTLGTCSVTDTKTVSVEACTTNTVQITNASNLGSSTMCIGYGVSLSLANSVGTQTWSTNSTNPQILVNPPITASYSVTHIDNLGCPKTGSIVITVIPEPQLTITASNTLVCAGSTSTLTASGANTYTWTGNFTGNVNGASIIATPSVSTIYLVAGSNAGCTISTQFSITVSACTGIDELDSFKFLVYPNPAANYVTVVSNSNLYYEIYNLIGVKVAIGTINEKQNQIDVSNLNKGIYILQLNDGKTKGIKRIIKE